MKPPDALSTRLRRRVGLCAWLLGLLVLPVFWVWVDPHTARIQAGLAGQPTVFAILCWAKPLGKFGPQIILLLAFWVWAARRHRTVATRWLVATLLCVAATALSVNTLKLAVGRERPKYGYERANTAGLVAAASSNRYRSFPSGDTAAVFAIAAAALSYAPRAGLGLLALGVLIGLSRISTGMHHPADVWAAMLMGLGLSWLVLARWRRGEAAGAVTTVAADGEEDTCT